VCAFCGIEQMADTQLQHGIPNSGSSAFSNLKGHTDVSVHGGRLGVVSSACLNKCNILAIINVIEGAGWWVFLFGSLLFRGQGCYLQQFLSAKCPAGN